MYASPMKTEAGGMVGDAKARAFLEQHVSDGSKPTDGMVVTTPFPIMRPGEYRIANVELARQAERNMVKVRKFDRKDRFYAWRVRTKKIKMKKLARGGMGKGKKKGRPTPPKKA